MTHQLSLFDLIAPKAIIRPVEPYGSVIDEQEIDEVLRFKHPKMAWDRCRIELHQHMDGLWMWSTSCCTNSESYGYRVGPKWGKFADRKCDALWLAVEEIKQRFLNRGGTQGRQILKWAEQLRPPT